MEEAMKKLLFTIILILFAAANAGAEDYVGRFVQVVGDVDITDVTDGRIRIPRVGTQISEKHKIRTGNRSYVEITLNEGTKIFIEEGTVARVSNLKKGRKDAPTRIKMLIGKIRVNVSRPSDGRTLIVETTAAIAGVPSVSTDFGIITSRYETRVAVFDGKVDIANADRTIQKSYTLMRKEESVIQLNKAPTEPVTLPSEIINEWVNYYEIAGGGRIVIKGKDEDGIIGHILRKREF